VLSWAICACAAAVIGLSATAQATTPPVKDHAWGSCTLSATVQNAIKNALQAESPAFGTVSVDFIVVHAVATQNDGQPLQSGGNTGVVLCTFPGTSTKVTAETTPIPNATDQPGSTNIDILQVQQQAVQQYKINDGARANKIEKRVCQTTQGNTDCWRVFKP
jgi:hypothetical protein